jgi:hypothetical protein
MGAATRGFADDVGFTKAAALDKSTLSGQTVNLHDELSQLESAVNALEAVFEPVLKDWPTGDNEGELLESLPPAVDSVRQAGFRVGALQSRLVAIRQRLAL